MPVAEACCGGTGSSTGVGYQESNLLFTLVHMGKRQSRKVKKGETA